MIFKNLKIFIGVICLVSLFFLCCCTSGIAGIVQRPDEDTINDPGLPREVLDNGLVMIASEIPGAEIESISIFVKAGSAQEAEYSGSGISHFVEHMIFKGTKIRRAGKIEEQVKSLGGTVNGGTTYDYTNFEMSVPFERFYEGIEILSDAIMNPLFDANEFKKEKDVILREINMDEDDPGRYFSELIWSSVYTTHPYRYPIIGYESIFKKLTRDDLLKYHKAKYCPNNIVIAVAGPIKPKEAFAILKSQFKNFKMNFQNVTVLPEEPLQVTKREVSQSREVSLARLAVCYRGVPVNNKDLFALDVLSLILGQGDSSRLHKKLVVEKDLAYSAGSFNDTSKYQGFFGIACLLEEKNIQPAKKIIFDTIEDLKYKPINDSELAKAKRVVLTDYIFSLESVSGQSSELALNEVLCNDVNFSKRYIEGIDSVTAKGIQDVARRYLNENSMTVISLKPAKFEGAIKKEEFFRKEKGLITKIVLNNGARLLVKEDHSSPVVSINICFPGGTRFEDIDNNGISNLMSTMLTKGTKTMTQNQVSDFVDTKGAIFEAYSGNNAFGLDMKIIKQDLNQSLDFLYDCLSQPSFDSREFNVEKQRVLAAIESEQDDIFAFATRSLKETLFKKHPFRFQVIGSQDSVSKLTREDIIDFYNKHLSFDNMVISIFGDVDKDAVAAKIESVFANGKKGKNNAMDGQKNYEWPVLLKEPSFDSPREIKKYLPKEQAVVMLGFFGVSINDQDRYVLDVIDSILSGEGGRLYSQIRQKGAMSYIVGSYSVFGLDSGYSVFYAASTPKDIYEAKNKILKQLNILAKNKISIDELKRAKEELIGQEKINLQTNTSLSFVSSMDELYGLGFDNYLKYENNIRSVTVDDVLRVADKYLSTNGYACVIILPRT